MLGTGGGKIGDEELEPLWSIGIQQLGVLVNPLQISTNIIYSTWAIFSIFFNPYPLKEAKETSAAWKRHASEDESIAAVRTASTVTQWRSVWGPTGDTSESGKRRVFFGWRRKIWNECLVNFFDVKFRWLWSLNLYTQYINNEVIRA